MSSEHTHPSFLWSVVQAASTHILALTAKIHEREAFFSSILTRSQQILPNSLEIQKEIVLVIISIIKTSVRLFHLRFFGTRLGLGSFYTLHKPSSSYGAGATSLGAHDFNVFQTCLIIWVCSSCRCVNWIRFEGRPSPARRIGARQVLIVTYLCIPATSITCCSAPNENIETLEIKLLTLCPFCIAIGPVITTHLLSAALECQLLLATARTVGPLEEIFQFAYSSQASVLWLWRRHVSSLTIAHSIVSKAASEKRLILSIYHLFTTGASLPIVI